MGDQERDQEILQVAAGSNFILVLKGPSLSVAAIAASKAGRATSLHSLSKRAVLQAALTGLRFHAVSEERLGQCGTCV